MTAITIIGAGSTVFAAELVTDFLAVPSIERGEIRLIDIDPVRLDLAHRFASHLVERSGKDWSVSSSVERTDLLSGSDVVINTIEVAGAANVEHDYAIPMRYGVDQCIGDTIGPGGIFKALRTVPAWLAILDDIARLCPGALVLNFTNPMSIMVLAASRASTVPVFGLCHSVHYTIESLAGYLDIDRNGVEFSAAGVNHLAWITELTVAGEDAYPELRRRGQQPEIWEQDPVRFELMYAFGKFPTESSGHVSEYVPYFRPRAEDRRRYTRSGYRGESGFYAHNWPTWRRDNDAYLESVLAGEDEAPLARGDEYASYLVEATVTGVERTIYTNVPNHGLVEGLGDGVVEVPATVDRSGIHPQPHGPLEPPLASLCRAHMDVHDLVVASLLEEDREAAVHALMLDPLTAASAAPAQIRALFDEMVGAQRDFLPGYLRG